MCSKAYWSVKQMSTRCREHNLASLGSAATCQLCLPLRNPFGVLEQPHLAHSAFCAASSTLGGNFRVHATRPTSQALQKGLVCAAVFELLTVTRG